MSQSGPSRKEFADLFNQVLGRNVMNEQVMEQLLREAKESYRHQGMDGIFEYIRQLTQAPLNNKEMKSMMDTILASSSPGQALDRLGDQDWLPQKSAKKLKRQLEESERNQKRDRGKRIR